MGVKITKGVSKPPLVTDQQVEVALYFLKGEIDLIAKLLTMKIESDLYYNLLTNCQQVAWDETH